MEGFHLLWTSWLKPTQLRGLGCSQVCVTVTRDPSFHVDPRKVIHEMQIGGGSMMLHESQGAMIHHDIIEIIEVFKILLDMLVVGGGRDRSVRCSHKGLQKSLQNRQPFGDSMVHHDTLRSILCSILVALFLTNKSGDDDESPWAGWFFCWTYIHHAPQTFDNVSLVLRNWMRCFEVVWKMVLFLGIWHNWKGELSFKDLLMIMVRLSMFVQDKLALIHATGQAALKPNYIAIQSHSMSFNHVHSYCCIFWCIRWTYQCMYILHNHIHIHLLWLQ